MLDKKTDAVLELLALKAGTSYKVLNKNQLLDDLPKKLKIDLQSMLSIVTFLSENEYVDVKYQYKEEICISLTVKAQSYIEGEKDIQQKAKITNGQVGLLFFGVILSSFFGALLEVFIGKII